MPYTFGTAPTTQSGFNFSFGGADTGSPGLLDKVKGFGLSALESFPEIFGIEPTERTQTYRAQNPVSGFLSQAAGAFVPYVAAGKVARSAPLIGSAIDAAEALGKGPISRAALGTMAELVPVEAGRLAVSSTGLPHAAYQTVTGRDAPQEGLGQMAGESLVNIGAGGVLGGLVGGLAARFAKGPKISDLVPGAAPDQPLMQQARALNETVAAAQDPVDPLKIEPDQLERLARERDQRIRFNLMDIEPNFTDTGETVRGPYRQDLGKSFRPLVGDEKGTTSTFLNNANNWKSGSPTRGTANRRLIYDPTERGGYASEDELANDLNAIGMSREELALNAQDIKTIEVKAGEGKKPKPEDYASPLEWLKDKVGNVMDFYHGTASNIDEWKADAGYHGGISFSTDPKFASNWAEGKALTKGPSVPDFPENAKVYVTSIKHDPNKIGDYQDPASVLKMIEASGMPVTDHNITHFKSGHWSTWENLQAMSKAGYDTVFMVENPNALPGSAARARNIFVTNGDRIYSAFDPQVQWAKNMRLHATEPVWNKPASNDPRNLKAKTIQNKFTRAPFADVGEGWKLAKEEDGLYVMAKKIAGEAEPAAGDKWVFFRTDRPDKFAPQAAKANEAFMKSAYYPKVEDLGKVGDPLFDAGKVFMDQTANQPLAKAEKKGPVGAFVRDSKETAETYLAPTAPLGTRNPLLNRAFQYLKHVESLAEARVDQLMRGTRTFHPERTLLRNVVTLDPPATDGLAKRIEELKPEDLKDIKFVLETELPFDQVKDANARKDINGVPLISDAAKDYLQAMQLISDHFTGRVSKLQKVVQNSAAQKLVAEFEARKGHYAISRDFPGAYRIFLHDPKGEVVGVVPGHSPLEARQAAEKVVAEETAKGNPLSVGGMLDEALRDPEQLARLKAKVLKPGFTKARGGLLGYELQQGELTSEKLRLLTEKNIKRRENYIRNVAMYEHLAETMGQLNRQGKFQDAQALDKVMRRMQGDEGEFARTQNAMVDKALHAVGLSGKDSASKIVQVTQKTLSSFTFNFGSITQPIQNLVGMFQTIVPEIAYLLHGDPESLARNYATLPLMNGQNQIKGSMGLLSEWKVFGNAMRHMGTDWKDLHPEHRNLIEELVRQRVLAPRFAEEQFGVDGAILKTPIAAFKSTGSFVRYFEAANELLMSKSEELNRMMITNSAWEIGNSMGLKGDRLVNFAREMMGKTAFNYGTADRATIFTTPIGSLMGTFKNWMFHYMANMVKYLGEAKEGNYAPLLWQTAATAVIGGGAATPLLLPLANGASQFLANKSFSEWAYNAAGGDPNWERVTDGALYGLPGALGVSFSSQVASPGSNPVRDAQMIWSFVALDRMKSLGQATKDALLAYQVSGQSPWADANVRDEMIRALAPRTIYRSYAVAQDMAVRSLATGYDVTKPMGPGNALLYAAGFNPTELEKTYDVYNQIRDDQNSQLDATKQLGATMAQALENGDDALATRVYARTMALGLDSGSVMRSAQGREARKGVTQLEFQAKPADRERFQFMFNDDGN